MKHELKTWKIFYDRVFLGDKRVEIRKEDDREFNVGDVLELHVWDTEKLKFTGEMCEVDVLYIHRGMGMQDQFCAMCISDPREVRDGL